MEVNCGLDSATATVQNISGSWSGGSLGRFYPSSSGGSRINLGFDVFPRRSNFQRFSDQLGSMYSRNDPTSHTNTGSNTKTAIAKRERFTTMETPMIVDGRISIHPQFSRARKRKGGVRCRLDSWPKLINSF